MSENRKSDNIRPNALAIIGMACRLPGARNVGEYWRNLRDGVESIVSLSDDMLRASGVPDELITASSYVKAAAPLDGMEDFDAGFFGFSPKDASIMDPQHRHFLECGWEAFEHAGYDPFKFPGSIGTFAGCGMQAYFTQNLAPNRKLMESTGMFMVRHTGNDKDFLATRLSYQFNLRGPSLSIQTACSTSLVAVHAAAQSLLSGECDLALAGGVTIELPHRQGYVYEEGEILSHDGHCRAFDADSTGTVFGSGVGAVVLKRLDEAMADGDTIHAVLIGSAVNNDGAGKVSYLAPSIEGQAAAISEALAVAGVEASTITYVETHGTGTQIGDPIEVTALTKAFRESTAATNFCALGAVKTNFGHLDTAAGVAGLIKTVLALAHKQIPPTLHFRRPNPQIQFATTPFFVNAQLKPWTLPGGAGVRRAGVNSLGVGGTNAHVILEESPAQPRKRSTRPAYLLTWSGRSEAVLDAMVVRFAEHLRHNPDLDLADAEFTLQAGRRAFVHRRIVAVRDVADALGVLETRDPKRLFTGTAPDDAPALVFMFPGGGVQYPNMGFQLYQRHEVYRRAIEDSLASLRNRWAIDLRLMMFPDTGKEAWAAEQLERPLYSILSIFITEYALAQLWIGLGLKPAMMTGHSLGEYTAACIAGVLSLEDALTIVVARGQIFERLPAGAMLSVRLSEAELRSHLSPAHSLAAINAPDLCVVSGSVEEVEMLAAKLDNLEVENQRLRINVAAHSPMLEPFLDEFRIAFKTIRFHPPKIPFISNLTGKIADPAEIGSAEYWVRHLRKTVRFSDGLRALNAAQPKGQLLEIGPGTALCSLATLHGLAAIPAMRHPKEAGPDDQYLLSALGRAWSVGVPIAWERAQPYPTGRRVPLPAYPFEHQRYWIEAKTAGPSIAPESSDELVRRSTEQWLAKPTWTEVSRTALVAEAKRAGRFILFGGPDDLASEISAELRLGINHSADSPVVIRLKRGNAFERVGTEFFRIDPEDEEQWRRAFHEGLGTDQSEVTLVHLSCVPGAVSESNRDLRIDDCFASVVNAARALAAWDEVKKSNLVVVTADAFSIAGECRVRPEQHLAVGALRVISREFAGVNCRLLDVSSAAFSESHRASMLRQIVEELHGSAEHREIAQRTGRRWTPNLTPVVLPGGGATKSFLKHGGVYLITGGLGGLGLELARYLVQKYKARLVLLSRSIGRSNAVDTNPAVRALQAEAEVIVCAADVADAAAVERAVQAGEARFGRIDGVFHCAGTIDDQLIVAKARPAMEAVLRPKVIGTRVIQTVFEKRPLDFVLLYSSTSSWLGLPGQVDYAAANAFLDAVASASLDSSPWPVRCIGWGAWKEVGMAARLVTGAKAGSHNNSGNALTHPYLGTEQASNNGRRTFVARWEAEPLWVLDGHRNKEGVALFPGTGYLELARAALRPGPGDTAVISDLTFIFPLVVQGPTEVQFELDTKDGDFVVTSRPVENGAAGRSVEHARGTARLESRPSPPRVDVVTLKAECATTREFGAGDPATRQDSMLHFGPRWANIRRAWFGHGVAVAEMQLPKAFEGDLELTPFHPAIVDIATAFALPLVSGYSAANWFYVPLSYRQVEIYRALAPRCYSIARCTDTNRDDSVTLDVTLVSTEGEVLARISGFTMKRLSEPNLRVSQVRDTTPASGELAREPNSSGLLSLQQVVAGGIGSEEGLQILELLLNPDAPPHVFASPFDLEVWRRLLSRQTNPSAQGNRGAASTKGELNDGTTVSQARPRIATPFIAPANEVEEKLAAVWKEALGLAEIGIDDNYFELGGNSLGLVQVVMKCRKVLKISIPMGDPEVLGNPTIRTLARFAAAKSVTADPADGGLTRVARDRYRTARKTL